MRKILRGLFLLSLGVVLAFRAEADGSLRMNYSEVLVENFQMGYEYSMRQAGNLPLEITNRYADPITVSISVSVPGPNQAKNGFEPLPDARWIHLGPSLVKIQPGQTYQTDVKIKIPEHDQFLGRKFQANLLCVLVEGKEKNAKVSMAISGRLLFTVAPARQKVDLGKSPMNLNFTLEPGTVLLEKFPLGKKVALLTSEGKPVLVDNPDAKLKKITLESIDPKTTVVLEPGFTPIEHPEFLTFEHPIISAKGKSKTPLRLFIELPDQPEYRDKKLFFIVVLNTGAGVVQGKQYLRVLIDTSVPEAKPVQESVSAAGNTLMPLR